MFEQPRTHADGALHLFTLFHQKLRQRSWECMIRLMNWQSKQAMPNAMMFFPTYII